MSDIDAQVAAIDLERVMMRLRNIEIRGFANECINAIQDGEFRDGELIVLYCKALDELKRRGLLEAVNNVIDQLA